MPSGPGKHIAGNRATAKTYDEEYWQHLAKTGFPQITRGGDIAALRVYQAHHPNAAIYTVTFNDRTVWMTSKQRSIWAYVKRYWMRDKRLTLQQIAEWAHCSRATVSRFLRRLDLWRFIDLITWRGRTGGTYILTRKPEPFKRWTMAMRNKVRHSLAAMHKRQMLLRLKPYLLGYKIPPMKRVFPSYEGTQTEAFQIGSTGATFMRDRYR